MSYSLFRGLELLEKELEQLRKMKTELDGEIQATLNLISEGDDTKLSMKEYLDNLVMIRESHSFSSVTGNNHD